MTSRSTAVARYATSTRRPLGFAGDAGTGGFRGQFFQLDTREWIGDGPIETPYCTYQSGHASPHVILIAEDTERAFRETIRRLLERNPEMLRGQLRCLSIDGHMHAPAFLSSDGSVCRPMQMWNSSAAADYAAMIRQSVGWFVPDRATVSHVLREVSLDPVAFRRDIARVTTQAGLFGFRLSGNHGLDPCEFSGLGVNDPQTGEPASPIDDLFDFDLFRLLPRRLSPCHYLGKVSEAGCRWMDVPTWWAHNAAVANPAGDQGAGRDGLGCRMEHAGLVLGSSVVVTTETTCRPDGCDFDPFFSSHGHFLNMGLHSNGLRIADGMVRELLSKFNGNENLLYETLGREADDDTPDCGGDFAVAFHVSDPGLGVKRPLTIQPSNNVSRGRAWRLCWLQQAMSVELRLKALSGDSLPETIVVGGAASRDNFLLQTIADALGVVLLRPDGAANAMLEGMKDRATLAEELAYGDAAVEPEVLMHSLRAAPSGREFFPRIERRAAFDRYRERFRRAIRDGQ